MGEVCAPFLLDCLPFPCVICLEEILGESGVRLVGRARGIGEHDTKQEVNNYGAKKYVRGDAHASGRVIENWLRQNH